VGSNLSVQGTISNVGNATVGSNLSVQGTISNTGSILAGSDLTVNGNTTQVGSYGAWMKCTLYSSSYGTAQTDILWNEPVFYNIVKHNRFGYVNITDIFYKKLYPYIEITIMKILTKLVI
jgi:hypothetical protein